MSEDFKSVQDMLEQAKELVNTLENKYNELSKPKNVRWRAEKDFSTYCPGDSMFYHLGMRGSINCMPDSHTKDSPAFYMQQVISYFKTAQEAKKYRNNLIITQKLKDIALRLNRTSAYFHFIYLDLDGELATSYQSIKVMGGIYCANPKFLETCIKEIGEKELIEYMKGC